MSSPLVFTEPRAPRLKLLFTQDFSRTPDNLPLDLDLDGPARLALASELTTAAEIERELKMP